MDVTSLNHGGQRNRHHLRPNAWVIPAAGEAQGCGMPCRRLSPVAPVWQVCLQRHRHSRRGCQRLQRAKTGHASTCLVCRSSEKQKLISSPFECGENKGKKPRLQREKRRERGELHAVRLPSDTQIHAGSAPLVLQHIDEEIMFWFASIWDQSLNSSLPEKSWRNSRTQELRNQTSQTHAEDTWHLLFAQIRNPKADSANTYYTDGFAATSHY